MGTFLKCASGIEMCGAAARLVASLQPFSPPSSSLQDGNVVQAGS